MALFNCPECGNPVSTAAPACPSCGFPVAAQMAKPGPAPDTLLVEVRPSWWNFFWHLLFFWLVVPFLIAWWRRFSVVLRIYPGRIMLERGLLSKSTREFDARDIRSIEIDQSFLARIIGIGDLTISTAATVDAVENVEGIPDPKGIRDLILAQRQSP
jgi:hypothetical protein